MYNFVYYAHYLLSIYLYLDFHVWYLIVIRIGKYFRGMRTECFTLNTKNAGWETQKEEGGDAPFGCKTWANEVKRRCWQCRKAGKEGGKETRFPAPWKALVSVWHLDQLKGKTLCKDQTLSSVRRPGLPQAQPFAGIWGQLLLRSQAQTFGNQKTGKVSKAQRFSCQHPGLVKGRSGCELLRGISKASLSKPWPHATPPGAAVV